MEGAIFAAEVANADNNNLLVSPTISKLDFSSVGPPLPLDSLFKRTKSSIKQNVSTITRAVCSSGFISAVKAEITNNDDDDSNADDESNIENNTPSGIEYTPPPPAPSKSRNNKRIFVELGDDNNEQQEEWVVSRLRNAFSQSMWNVKNGSGFRDRSPPSQRLKRLRITNTSPSNSTTSNTFTNNAVTDTTAAVEEEEVEFFTENCGFNDEEGDALPGDGTSTGELNDDGDSIKELMDISADEESSPSTITSAVSNTGENESVANDLILEGELQLSHFNNYTAFGSNAGEGTLTAAVVDNNVLPAAEKNQPGTEGEEEDIRRPEVGDVMSLKYEGTGDAVGVVCEVTRDKLSLAFVDKEGAVYFIERDISFTDKDLKYVTDEHGNIKKMPVPRPTVGMHMSLKYTKEGECEGLVCEVTQDTLSLAFVGRGGVVNFVERGILFTDEDLKYVTDKNGGIKKGTVPEGWEEWKPLEDQSSDEEDDDIDIEDDGK